MVKQPTHTITIAPWRNFNAYGRVICEATSAMLWPLSPDERMTILISLLANHIPDVAESDDQVDAVLDVLRMQLRRTVSQAASPPLQNY